MTAVLAALGAAACFAVATALQHRGASRLPSGRGLGLALLARLLRSPSWLGGLVLGAAGLALHTWALATGRLPVVQPLLVTGLLFTLLTGAVLEHRRPSRADGGWGSCVALGLVLFLVSARPDAGSALAPSGALVPTLLVAVALAGACVAGSRLVPARAAVLLGSAAGCCFGVTAALLKQLTGLAATSLTEPLRTWPLYALVVVGVLGIALAQSAYQAGPLSASVPALTVVEPLVAAIVGALAFGEVPSAALPALAGQLVGAGLMAAGVLQLAAPAAALVEARVPEPVS
ncbi:MAG: hypothetical protein JWN17_2123 [Frankiales bacterium]|nr:hypothetical protein [Frankiales bacterium]